MRAIVYSLLGVSFFLFGEVAQAQVVSKTSKNKSSKFYKSPEKASANTTSVAELTIAEINERLNAEEESSIFDKTMLSADKCYLTEQLLNVAADYTGTKYVWGGMSRSGMDCSGFVKTAFDTFEIDLPRTSREMSRMGEKIDKSEAQPGDLIFFKNGGNRVINHVGIVVEVNEDEIKFIHSSTSRGVIISSTKQAYYKRGFTQINRIYDRSYYL